MLELVDTRGVPGRQQCEPDPIDPVVREGYGAAQPSRRAAVPPVPLTYLGWKAIQPSLLQLDLIILRQIAL